MIFCLFGVQWVLSQSILAMLACWKGRFPRRVGGFWGGGGGVGGRDWCCVGCSLCAFCGWFGRSATVELSKDLRGLQQI